MKIRNFAIKTTAAALAAIAAMTCTSVTSFAAENRYYTSVDALMGIEFSSFNDLAEFVKGNSGKSVINGIEKEVSDFLLNSDSIYIPAPYANKTSEIDSIIITPTYISTTFIIDNVRHSLYHYFADETGFAELEDAKRYYKEKRYSCDKKSLSGNTVYYYELLEEWYYAWEQKGEYFLLRVGSSGFDENDAKLCSLSEISLNGENAESGFMKTEKGTYYIKADGSYAKGWLDIEGKTYYFGSNGLMTTKARNIKGVRYKFSSDGVCKGKFTGSVKSSKGKRYYKNGVLCKDEWIKMKDGKSYYAGSDGYLRTGWASINGKICYFDKNGVWDGKKHYTGYKPKSMKYFLMDFDYSDDLEYEYCINFKKYYDFEGIDAVREILEAEKDRVFVFDNSLSDDETEVNNKIYRGGKEIIIRCDTKTKTEDKVPHIIFTKDKKGNSYFYCSQYGFGCRLSDSDAYDKIAELIS